LIDENRTKLTNLVAQTDDQSLRDTLKSILIRTTPNWSLTSRINDLKKAFQTAGFQGDVAAPKITRLRGKIAHGKQTQLNEKELKLLVACEHYLLALARFTLLREVGLSDAEISRGFYQSVTYGIFRIPPTEST
ncbi:MAG: HEPN domain-containing protein, partial [Planktomarina sp.]